MSSNLQRYIKSVYTEETLRTAILAYKRIAKIKLITDGEYFLCEFNDCVIDPSTVIHEFNNYLIELLNSQGETTE